MIDKLFWSLMGFLLCALIISWYGTYSMDSACKKAGGRAVKAIDFETICVKEESIIKDRN